MARTSLTVATTAASGVVITTGVAAESANGNEFTNTGREIAEITNGATQQVTATFVTNDTYDIGSTQYAVADLAVVVATGTQQAVGPFDRTLFNSTTGTVQINWTTATNCSVRVISLGTA